jgi:hypothetical protein
VAAYILDDLEMENAQSPRAVSAKNPSSSRRLRSDRWEDEIRE